jgi:hypothetical protein
MGQAETGSGEIKPSVLSFAMAAADLPRRAAKARNGNAETESATSPVRARLA